MEIALATTNIDKYNSAKMYLAKHGISVMQYPIELIEPQLFDGEAIARAKVQDAFSQLKKPVFADDDNWEVPVLNGFPGPYMKQCNHYLTSEDWLHLMADKSDRRAFLIKYLAFTDGKMTRVFSHTDECYFLNTIRGEHDASPNLRVLAMKGATESIAEEITAGGVLRGDREKFWAEVAEWLLARGKE